MRSKHRLTRAAAAVEPLDMRRLLTATAVTPAASFHGTDGSHPSGVLYADVAGDVYGLAAGNGSAANEDGTLWELPAGGTAIKVLAAFDAAAQPGPTGGVGGDADGNLYGVFQGQPSETGSEISGVWQYTAATGRITTRAKFTAATGTTPGGPPTVGTADDGNGDAGDLFGTTIDGGTAGDGAIWELAAGSGTIRVLASFDATIGTAPTGTVVLDVYGRLYGTTSTGGPTAATPFGTVWTYDTVTPDGLNVVAAFDGTDGANPTTGLTTDGVRLYGTTSAGGPDGDGGVFEDNLLDYDSGTAGHGLFELAAFDGGAGGRDANTLTYVDGTLYGTAAAGGPDGGGVVFSVSPGAAVVQPVAAFTAAGLHSPIGGVVFDASGDLITTAAAGDDAAGDDAAGDGGVVSVPAATLAGPAAVHLAFTTTPASAVDETALGPTTVTVEDTDGQPVGGDDSTVTLALAAAPAGVTLGGTLTATAVDGVATFDGVTLGSTGDNPVTTGTFTLMATGGTDGAAASVQVAIVAAGDPAPAVAVVASSVPTEYGAGGIGTLTANAKGDLFAVGVSSGSGALVEVPAGTGGVRTLYTFTLADVLGSTGAADAGGGGGPGGPLVVDAAGDLFGTLTYSENGGATGSRVFELPAGARALTIVANLPGVTLQDGLVADAAGDVFAPSGAYGEHAGTVYEITAGTHAVRDLGLADTGGGELLLAPDGDLYGVAQFAGPGELGTLFRVPADGGAYDQPAVTLADFTDADGGRNPFGPPAMDAAGDLFGATGAATVYELPAGGSTPQTLLDVTGFVGYPTSLSPGVGPVTTDAAGDVFGVTTVTPPIFYTMGRGYQGPPAVYELPADGHAFTNLAAPPATPEVDSDGPLTLSPGGTLYGTADGGGIDGGGVVYQVTNAVVTPTPTATPTPSPTLRAATPTVGRSTLAAAVVAGTRSGGSVRVTLANDTAAAARGAAVVRVYAVPVTVAAGTDPAAAGTLVGTVRRRLSLAAGRSIAMSVPVRLPATLAAGSYTLDVESADPAAALSTAVGPALTVSSPTVTLTAVIETVAPTAAGRTAVVAVSIGNVGNTPFARPLTVTIDVGGTDPIGAVFTDALGTAAARLRLRPGPRAATVRVRVPLPAALAKGPYQVRATVTAAGTPAITSSVGSLRVT